MKRITAMTLALLIGFSATSCFGTFQLTRNIYQWNDSVSDNKFVKSLVFWGMNIIPVYSVVAFADVVIFNLIEFWSGSNPISMAPGEIETDLLSFDGVDYEVTASQNRFDIQPLNGEAAFALVFNPEIQSWNLEGEAGSRELVRTLSQNGIDYVQVYSEQGEAHVFELNKNYSQAYLASEMTCQQLMANN